MSGARNPHALNPGALASGSELLDVVRRNDRTEINHVVGQFRAYREAVWAHAHANMPRRDASYLAGLLDVGTFALATPTCRAFQAVFDSHLDEPALGLFEPGTRTLADRLARDASGHKDVHSRLAVLGNAVGTFTEACITAVQPRIWTHDALRAIAMEHAQFRRRSDLLMSSETQQAIRPNHEMIAADLRRGTATGIRIEFRLIEVHPRVMLEHGLTPTEQSVRQLADGFLLRAVARQKGVSTFAFERLASGCKTSCYTGEDGIRTDSPHRAYLDQYPNPLQFRKHHWRDMWFNASRFAIYKVDNEPRMHVAFSLSRAFDPLELRQVKDIPSRRKRIGCPVLSFGGIQDFALPIAEMCAHPEVFGPLVDFAQQTRSSRSRTPNIGVPPNNQMFVPETFVLPTDTGLSVAS